MEKQRTVKLSNEAWRMAFEYARKSTPRTTRPAWIDTAIREKAERDIEKERSK